MLNSFVKAFRRVRRSFTDHPDEVYNEDMDEVQIGSPMYETVQEVYSIANGGCPQKGGIEYYHGAGDLREYVIGRPMPEMQGQIDSVAGPDDGILPELTSTEGGIINAHDHMYPPPVIQQPIKDNIPHACGPVAGHDNGDFMSTENEEGNTDTHKRVPPLHVIGTDLCIHPGHEIGETGYQHVA